MDQSRQISTPPLDSMPVMQSEIPPEMFLRPINFDTALKGKQSGNPEMRNVHSGVTGAVNHIPDDVSDEESLEEMSLNKSQMENTMDMLEQRQAMEQARLLQRFKELRQWQMQQQEVLMKQQQMQLEILRKEQLSAQGLIVKQRESHWGGKVKLADNTTRTPPRSTRHHPHRGQGHAKAKGQSQPPQTSQQRVGQLPAPVMYVPLNDDNDEIKTNPDLFSDTNSQAGSHATTEDGFVQLPDSASEVGIRTKLTFMDEDELDEGIGTQSIQSPGRGEKLTRIPPTNKPRVPEVTSDSGSELEEQSLEDENEVESEISEEEQDDDDEEEDDDDEDTRFIHDEDDRNIDDKPVTGTSKTFEELLEEQLRAEEEKLRIHNEDKHSDNTPKRSFLKKGQGIARFGLSDKPATLPSKENVKSTLPEGARALSSKHSSTKGVKKKQEDSRSKTAENKQPQKTLSLKKSSPKKQQPSKISPREPVSKPSQNSKGKVSKPSDSSKSSQLSKEKTQKLEALNAKMLSKGNDRESHNQARQAGKMTSSQQKHTGHPSIPSKENTVSSRAPESIPDDESFVGRIKEREKHEELEKEDLEEFELLENFADNMSFCSNSSLVVKVLERDRSQKSAYTRTQPTEPAKVERSPLQSPRTTVAKQLEATLKRGGQQTGQVPNQALISASVPVVTKPATNNKISALKNQKDKDVVKDYIDRELGHKGQGRLSDVREDTEGEEKEIEDDNDDDDDSEFELSESESESSSDSDSESENSRTLTSPSKVMTRKIASNRDRTSLNSAYTTDRTGESVVVNEKTALDTVNNLLKRLTEKQLGSQVVEKQVISSEPTQLSMEFSQPIKSPIVISKEGGEIRDFRKNDNNGVDHDGSFHLHGKFSSQGGVFGVNKVVSKSDDDAELSDGSLSSYSDLKISKWQQNYGDSENEQRIGSNYPNNESSQSESEDVKDSDEEDRFDDEEEWNDLTPKAKSPAKHSHFGDTEEGPPTSKLVSKLFPNLKPPQTKQQAENQQRLQSVTSTATSDGVQSKLMREKLAQLEMEIEKFKNENLNLERLRKEREEGLAKLKKEIAAFEKEKSEELKRLQEYKIEETKKLKHEKKMFEKYQKAAREMPNKKEREEIEMLKSQLTDLQDEMKRKESRWTSNNARLRSKLELLEQENTELKEEIKLMEMKRLEWLQKEQNTKKGVQRNIGTTNAAYSQKISKQFTSNSADFQTTDSDEETDPVRDESNPHSLQDTVNSNTMSLRPSQYENLVNVRAPPANSKTAPTQQKLPAPSGGHVSKMAASTKGHEKPNASRMGQNKSTNAEKSVNMSSKSSKSSKSGPPSLLSVSTQLLHEDLPRGKPAIAAHQDTSMYSETETSMVDLPRKTNQKLGISKSVINKGDKGYDEMTHTDGKVERIYSTGAREILFTNGTRKEISADGQYISVSFFNGDIKQIMPDQRVIYYYSETQATHTTYPDGLEILQFPNNQVEKHYPDGTKEITFPDQIIKYLFPSGSEESIFPDGTVIKVDRNGDKTIEFPNGQREIHNQEYKRREYPDGTVKTVYPDGKQETRYSNGRIRVKDKDGNIIVDKRC